LGLKPGDFVVDIGSNDGLLLKKLKNKGCKVQGVDPAEPVATKAIEAGIPTIIGFIDELIVEKILSMNGPADFVTANNVFSHSDDLRKFGNMVRHLLSPNGVFVFEVSYLKNLVDGKVFDYIYHEHLAHHSVHPLRRFFESIGMRLFDIERIKVKGGSIRCFACLTDASWRESPAVNALIKEEFESKLYEIETFVRLTKFINELKRTVRDTLRQETEAGRLVASYGASATSTVLLRTLGITQYVSFIVDDNVDRQGRLSPGDLIPVYPSSFLTSKSPSLTFISTWRFADLILSRNSDYLAAGGRFMIPLPDIRLVSANG
jgi:SAM-dependent methyltransferase